MNVKKILARKAVVAALVAIVSGILFAAEEPRLDAISTVPHELDWLVQSGHIQGACCSEQGIYLSHSLGLDKIGWDGRLQKHIEVPGHLGDCAYANGRIYGAFLIWDGKQRKGGKKGLVRVWDENLEQVDEAWFDEALDGIAVLGDTIYVGIDRWGNKPHSLCCVKRLGLDLSDKGNVVIDLGYNIVFGVQTMATDGTSLFFSNYAVGPKDGNPERFNTTRLTPELKVVENLKFRCTQGFGLVPKTVSRRDAPVFFKVCAMGGDMHGWRKDPENNPPRIRIEFYEWKDGQFTSVTKEDDPADLGDFVWANDDPGKYVVRSVAIKDMKPGMCAEVTMWADASGLSEGGVPEASLAWGSRATGASWAGGSGGTVLRWNDPKIEKDSRGRRKFVVCTPVMPMDAVNPRLHFFAKKPATGKIVYSDIKLALSPREYCVRLANSAYANSAADGDVRFVATFITDPDSESADSLSGTFVFTDKDGRLSRKAAEKLTGDFAEVTLDVSKLALGEQDVRFELAKKDGKVLAVGTCRFERVKTLPKRRVAFDKFGRTLVDGKPFFPLGMYWSENTLSKDGALERYVAPGVFNCLQTYEKAMTPQMLDRYHKKGLMVLASVKDIYIRGPKDPHALIFPPKEVKTQADATAYVTDVVNRCKNHPALLAWYTCDEFTSAYAAKLEERYRLVKLLDPEHPVFVLAFSDAIRSFLRACDVTGTDPYPVCKPPECGGGGPEHPGMGSVWKAGDDAEMTLKEMFALKPLWQVPQAFKWQWDYKEHYEERFPTRRELSSMTWQQIAAGANAIFFYSYGQMMNNCSGESELIEYFDETTLPVAREVKRAEKILLLDPGPKVVAKPDRVRVRTWRHGEGAYVLVCNTHPERRTGEVRVEGSWKRCKSLFGSGISLNDGALSLDMPPIGVAIVKLEK